MCAIAGILGAEPPALISSRVQRMIGVLAHRGPDSEHTVTIRADENRHLVLGHGRLAILDLTESARQPMTDPATGSWLVYNGELYNFRELRRELETFGHSFRSSGDTEVMLKALVQWNAGALRRLRGMYAFAFWDGRSRRLMLGRDPFGIKPLLYRASGDSLVFASELRGIEAHGGASSAIDEHALRAFLTFGHVCEPLTAMREVRSLPPGHVLVVEDKASKPPEPVVTLEELFKTSSVQRLSFRDAVERTRSELQRAVTEQLVSDVPVGIFLSGGIDSSLVAGLAGASGVSERVTHLTVTFPEPDFSELERARAVANRVPGVHRTVPLTTQELLAMLPAALTAMDQPTVDGVNTYIVSRVAAQQGIKVVLSGLGGDELFSGYTTFWKAPLLAKHPEVIAKLAALAPRRFLGDSERAKLRRVTSPMTMRDAYLLQRSVKSTGEVDEIFRALPATSPLAELPRGGQHTSYQWISYLECAHYMRNQLLRDSDVFSSAHSIELRVPFLDLDVLRLAWQLPPDYHRTLRTGGKRLLKAVLHQLFPTLIQTRRKMGFVLPWKYWLREPRFFSMVADVINSRGLYAGLPISPDEGRRRLDAFAAKDPSASWFDIWSVFVLLKWVERVRTQLAAA